MLTIYRSEASASLRRVPMWFVTSNGTSPATAENAGQPQICWHPRGTTTVNTAATLSVVSANAGLYHVELSASEVSALGVFSVHYGSATAVPNAVMGKIVNFDSGDSVRFGQFALPNAAANVSGGLPIKGTVQSDFTVRLDSVVHSGATVGAGNFAPGVYSGVSFSVRDSGIATTSYQAGSYSGVSFEIKTGGIQTTSFGAANYSGVSFGVYPKGIGIDSFVSGTYSGVTFGISAIAPNSYSGVTIQGLSNYANISNVTLAAGTHSNVTIQGISNYANISNVTLAPGTHSNVTIQGVTLLNSSVTLRAGSHSGATIDGAMFLSAAGERSAASSLLSTTLGGTTPRLIQHSFELLRNKVAISGSTMTVYKADDTTSSWTATISTGTATVYGVAPGLV